MVDALTEPATRSLKRRWLQFSISSLLLLMLVCAVGLALIVVPAERQRRAVNYVESMEGTVVYEEDEQNDLQSVPGWLQQVLGEDYFQSVSEIELSGSPVSDAGLAYLNGLTGLKQLLLGETQVSDAGLAHLNRLPALEWLDLEGTQVTDAGLVNVKRLTTLHWLSLRGTQVGDAGLEHVKSLTVLDSLVLSDTRVSDAGIAELQRALPKCQILH